LLTEGLMGALGVVEEEPIGEFLVKQRPGRFGQKRQSQLEGRGSLSGGLTRSGRVDLGASAAGLPAASESAFFQRKSVLRDAPKASHVAESPCSFRNSRMSQRRSASFGIIPRRCPEAATR
jgi:hypothetical protein